jgi:signal transduction histidine kinase
MALDVRTILVMVSMLTIMFSILLALAGFHAGSVKGTKHWAAANLFLGLGFCLAFFFDRQTPNFHWAIVFAATAALLGISLQFAGILAFKGQRIKWHIFLMFSGVMFLLNVWFGVLHPNTNVRAILNSLSFALVYGACARALLIHIPPALRNAYRFTGIPFAILVVVLLGRAIVIWQSPSNTYAIYENIPINPFSFFFAIMVQLSVTFGFILMLHYRLAADLLDLAANANTEHLKAEQARQEAENANAAKSKFLAAVSHDLRQPIHAQGLFLGALALTKLNAHQQEILSSANATSKSSVEMLNTLLDFSRIEAGVIEPNMQAFRLQPLLNKIEREFESQADEKGIAYRSRETVLAVHSDPMLVELIIRNLVSNAIRYTEHGGILVACRKRGAKAILEVWDTGIGIATENKKMVFREFLQLANPERDRQKGLGLGLAIVHGLARTLQIDLSVESTLGQGSVFRLSLPITVESMSAQECNLEQVTMSKINRRVLVIDDDEIVREGMRILLRDWGCECDVADSIEEALYLARSQAPEIIICDYRLRENRTGIEAINALRSMLGNTLPALLITGDIAPDRLRESIVSGIPNCINRYHRISSIVA